MRKQKHLRWNISVLFLSLSLFAGCQRVPEPRTILLPEEETEQGVALEGEEGDRYAVRKMYNEDYETLMFGGCTAFLQGTGEHQVRLAESGTDGLRVRTLDYHYGFYESGLFPVGEMMAAIGIDTSWHYGTRDEQNMAAEFFSPDGRYLLYVRRDKSLVGGRLYLLDLESGQEELLLDGDEGVNGEYSGDEFMILAAWSRDASLLCYGFYPRYASVWSGYMGENFLLHFRDMDTGKTINRLNYYYSGNTQKSGNLEGTRLYVDRDGDKILTAIVSEMESEGGDIDSEQSVIDFFPQEIPQPGMETEGVVIPSVAACPRDTRLYLDAGTGHLYFTSVGEGIISLDLEDGTYVNSMPIGPSRGIRDFCVLDGGEAFVVAEYDQNHMGDMGPQDICLYTQDEEAGEHQITRRVLYQNAGYVIRLQYDPVCRRLLAETGIPDFTMQEKSAQESKKAEAYINIQWESNRSALVLEF